MFSSGKGNTTESGREIPDWMLPEQQGRHWYGRKRKSDYRKPTPKGGYDRFRGYDAIVDEDEQTGREGVDMPAAIMVLGGVALVLSFVPLIKYVAVLFAIVAVVLATREFARIDPFAKIKLKGKDVRDQRFCRIGRFLAILAVISVVASVLWGVKTDRDNRIKAGEGGTSKVLEQDLRVEFGVFEVGQDAVGAETRRLPVTFRNKADSTRSFEAQIECLDGDNRRIASQTVFAPKMRAGEERSIDAFGYVDSETTQQLKTATCRVATAKSE
ncbi:hypothetical protein GCM10009547_33630 [Sporichthya brevicatena]|uniref:Uncharacterized protein n=1 Tax=Sporichthya brevicatena TaxID=171442 RepID=A0ABN1H2N9_9ACTN